MNFLSRWVIKKFNAETFLKLRHAYQDRSQILKTLSPHRASNSLPVNLNDRILVVGTGIAALTVLQQLRQNGFRQVTILTENDQYGGKCVNLGCMPSEYLYAQGPDVSNFIFELRRLAQSQFETLGYPIRFARVERIEKNRALLAGNQEIEFDRLILACGSRMKPSPNLRPTLSLESFWNEPASGHLVITSEGNVAALSIADLAIEKGYTVTLLLRKSTPLAHLPSFRYFRQQIEKRGAKILEGAHWTQLAEKQLDWVNPKQSGRLSYDHLLDFGIPNPELLPIDGKKYTFYDVDLRTASLMGRTEISVLGDTSGLMSASEAELQARSLLRSWVSGYPIPLEKITTLPLRLHAKSSLAIVGAPWTFGLRSWREIDFRQLGWTLIHRKEGKLWYHFDPESRKVHAIQICHPDAGELIATAAALIDHPIDNLGWLASFAHPSAGEIFKVMAEEILRAHALPLQGMPLPEALPLTLRLPPIQDLDPEAELPSWITKSELRAGLLSKNPTLYFATLFGLKQMQSEEAWVNFQLEFDAAGKARLLEPTWASLEYEPEHPTIRLSGREISIHIHFNETV